MLRDECSERLSIEEILKNYIARRRDYGYLVTVPENADSYKSIEFTHICCGATVRTNATGFIREEKLCAKCYHEKRKETACVSMVGKYATDRAGKTVRIIRRRNCKDIDILYKDGTIKHAQYNYLFDIRTSPCITRIEEE